MRITAGYARGILLNSPTSSATRPATDAARLALFSSLGEAVEGARVLDIFAGTGAYGLEAVSRGAKSAVFVENAPQAFAVLKSNIALLKKTCQAQMTPIMSDALKCSRLAEAQNFDFVFADPPYALLQNKKFSQKLYALFCELAESGATIMLEAPAEYEIPEEFSPSFEVLKRLGKKSKGKPSQLIFAKAQEQQTE